MSMGVSRKEQAAEGEASSASYRALQSFPDLAIGRVY